MNARATPAAIISRAEDWRLRGVLEREHFEETLRYFKDRYYNNGQFLPIFGGLNFRQQDRRLLVESVLSGQSEGLGDIVAALLLIAIRLRNNLFHGEKWAYGIREQETNFLNANQLLMRVCELE
jgi:hypothetical protein